MSFEMFQRTPGAADPISAIPNNITAAIRSQGVAHRHYRCRNVDGCDIEQDHRGFLWTTYLPHGMRSNAHTCPTTHRTADRAASADWRSRMRVVYAVPCWEWCFGLSFSFWLRWFPLPSFVCFRNASSCRLRCVCFALNCAYDTLYVSVRTPSIDKIKVHSIQRVYPMVHNKDTSQCYRSSPVEVLRVHLLLRLCTIQLETWPAAIRWCRQLLYNRSGF